MSRTPGRNKFFRTRDGRVFTTLPSAKKHAYMYKGQTELLKKLASLIETAPDKTGVLSPAQIVYDFLRVYGLLKLEKSYRLAVPSDFNPHTEIEKSKVPFGPQKLGV